jgi:hypothetical protein
LILLSWTLSRKKVTTKTKTRTSTNSSRLHQKDGNRAVG